MSRAPSTRELLARARRAGCRVTHTRRGHYSVKLPDGESVVLIADSGNWRGVKNALGDFRRAGLPLD